MKSFEAEGTTPDISRPRPFGRLKVAGDAEFKEVLLGLGLIGIEIGIVMKFLFEQVDQHFRIGDGLGFCMVVEKDIYPLCFS